MASSSQAIPKIVVYPDRAYIRQRVPTDTIVPYVSDINSVSLHTRSSEIAVALESVASESEAVVSYNGITHKGTVLSVDPKRITLATGDSTVVTRYDSIAYKSAMRFPDSYIVAYMVGKETRSIPELHYMTNSIRWTPIVHLNVESGIISLIAMIVSDRSAAFNAEFTVATYGDGVKHGSSQARGAKMMSAAPSSDSGSDSSAPSEFIHEIGDLTLGRSLRYPMFSHPVGLERHNFIDLHQYETRSEGPAITGYIFKAPMGFPDSELTVVDQEYENSYRVKSHQIDQMMIVKTYASSTTRYGARVSDVAISGGSSSSGTSPTRHEVTISLAVDKNSGESENLVVTYELSGVKIVSIEPPAVKNIKIPGKVVWLLGSVFGVKKPVFTIVYDV